MRVHFNVDDYFFQILMLLANVEVITVKAFVVTPHGMWEILVINIFKKIFYPIHKLIKLAFKNIFIILTFFSNSPKMYVFIEIKLNANK